MRPALVAAAALLAGPAAAAIAHIEVTSAAFAAGGAIPARYSAYGQNRSPPLRWTPVARAKSYAVILDDPDAHGRAPFVHWVVWNIPAGTTSLAEGAAAGVAGVNGTGKRGYFGPHPPSGLHHYHLRVVALNAALTLPASADRAVLGRAMSGHVIGQGELIGTYAAPAR